jgi:hypothetical protein
VDLLEKEGMKDLYIYIHDTIYPLEKSYIHSSVGGGCNKQEGSTRSRKALCCLLAITTFLSFCKVK